jgi:uncharacterized RDD family membrane protein YckC
MGVRMEQRIGFGKRLGAWALDCVFVIILSVVGGTSIGGWLGAYTGAMTAGAASSAAGAADNAQAAAALGGMFGAIMGMVLAATVIATIYFLIEGFTGYTLGKLILGIRIANEDGTKASVPRLLLRWLVKNSGSVITLLAVFTATTSLFTVSRLASLIIFVGCFFTLGMKRQAFHDMAAKTAVYPKGAIK